MLYNIKVILDLSLVFTILIYKYNDTKYLYTLYKLKRLNFGAKLIDLWLLPFKKKVKRLLLAKKDIKWCYCKKMLLRLT